MKRISVLAEKYQCAIILIGHINRYVMENHPIVDWVLLTFKRQQEAY